jgi:hypothetical protein
MPVPFPIYRDPGVLAPCKFSSYINGIILSRWLQIVHITHLRPNFDMHRKNKRSSRKHLSLFDLLAICAGAPGVTDTDFSNVFATFYLVALP